MRGYSSWLLAKALGTGFSQFVHPVFQRCINIIQIQHLAKVDPASAGVQYDKKFVVCSLDLLSGLTEGLGSGIEGRQEISPVVMTVVSSLVPILQHAEGLNKSLIENSSITLGRLAWVCPELVSPHMAHFMQSWCIALSMIRDDIEKEDAFRGLCTMVRANPSGPLSSLTFMCKAIASWHEIRSEELQNEIFQVLLGYKQMLGNGAWEQCMSSLEAPVKEKLSKYQV